MEGSVIQLNELFTFENDGEVDDDGKLVGTPQPTGLRPTFESKLKAQGVDFGAEMFGELGGVVVAGGGRR